MNDDVVELMRLRQIRHNLDLPAYMFERWGGDCKGDCDRPIAVMTASLPEALTCCNLHPVYEHWRQISRLERALSAKIQSNKADKADPEPVDAPLADKYARTFTGTYVGRKLVSGDK
jgi:hypothetical protein